MGENWGISPVFVYNREARHTLLRDAKSSYIVFSMFSMVYNAIDITVVELPCLLAGRACAASLRLYKSMDELLYTGQG